MLWCKGCLYLWVKKSVVLPLIGNSEYLGWSVAFFTIILFKLKSTQSITFGWIFHLFFFSQKRWKNHPIWQKIGAFPTLTFSKFYFWRWVGHWGQHSPFFFLGLKQTHTTGYEELGLKQNKNKQTHKQTNKQTKQHKIPLQLKKRSIIIENAKDGINSMHL